MWRAGELVSMRPPSLVMSCRWQRGGEEAGE